MVSIELDLIALQLHLILHLGEVEDPRKIEGIVYIEVNPEKRLLKGLRIELVVEGNVVLILQLRGLLGPSGCTSLIWLSSSVSTSGTILPLLLLPKDDGHREEFAVLIEER